MPNDLPPWAAVYQQAQRWLKAGCFEHLVHDLRAVLRLAAHVSLATTDDRAAVGQLAQAVQAATAESVDLAYVDQGYTGERAATAARAHGIELEVVKLAEAKRGVVLLLRRWVAERIFGWAIRFRRLVRDYERLPQTLANLHVIALVCIMLRQVINYIAVHNSLS